jgi:hypothetical protein
MGYSKWAQDMIVGSRWVGSIGWEGGGWEEECIQEKGEQEMGYSKWAQDMIVGQ